MNSTQTATNGNHAPLAQDAQGSVPRSAGGLHESPLVQSASGFRGPDRRVAPRIPRTLEISVQPLDVQLVEVGTPFFAITRDISQGGLAYLSSRKADFEKAVVALNEGIGPGIVCRICNTSIIHRSGRDEVWLTNVQFLHLHQRRG